MGGSHLIQISWNGGDLEEVRPYALKYIEAIHNKNIETPDYKDEMYDAELFFESIESGKSYFGGTKGQLWCWGTIAKFPDMEIFLEVTVPFFKELWEKEIILKQRTVVLFDEHDDEHPKIHMIIYNDPENYHTYDDLPLDQVSVIRPDIDEFSWRT
jgi:hypothetical protein